MYYHDNTYGKRLPGERYIQEENQNLPRFYDERRARGRQIANLETPNFIRDAENIKVRDPLSVSVRETDSVLVRERDLNRYRREVLDDVRYREDERFAGPNHYPEPPAPRMPYYAHPAQHPPLPHRAQMPIRGGPWQENYYRNHPPPRRRHHLDDIYLENYDEEETNEEGHQPAYRPPIRVAVQTTKSDTVTKEQAASTKKNTKSQGSVEAQSRKNDNSSKKCTNEDTSLKITKNINNKAVSKGNNSNTTSNKIVKVCPKPKSDLKGPAEEQNKLSEPVNPTKSPTGSTLNDTIKAVPLSKDSSKESKGVLNNAKNKSRSPNQNDLLKTNPNNNSQIKDACSKNEIAKIPLPQTSEQSTEYHDQFKIKCSTGNKTLEPDSTQYSRSLIKDEEKEKLQKPVLEKTNILNNNREFKITDQSAKDKLKSVDIKTNSNDDCSVTDKVERNSSIIEATKKKNDESETDIVKELEELVGISHNNKNTVSNPIKEQQRVCQDLGLQKECVKEAVESYTQNAIKEHAFPNRIFKKEGVKKVVESNAQNAVEDHACSNTTKECVKEAVESYTQNAIKEHAFPNRIFKKEGVKKVVESNAQNAVEDHACSNTTLTSTSLSPEAIKKDIKINLIHSPQQKSPLTTKSLDKRGSTSESTTDRPVNIRNEINISDKLLLKGFNNLNDPSVTPVSSHILGTKIQETNKVSVFLEDIFILEDAIKNIDGPCETIEVPSSPTENGSSAVLVDNKKNTNSCQKFETTSDKKEFSSKKQQLPNVQIIKENLAVKITDNTELGIRTINNNPSNGSFSPIKISIESPDEDSRSPTNLEIRKTFEQSGRPLEDFRIFDTRDSFLGTFHQQFDDPRVVDMDISNTPSPSKNLISTEEPAKTEQQKVSDRVIQGMDALWNEISSNETNNSNSESETKAILKVSSMTDKIREKIKLFKSKIMEINLEFVNPKESSPKEQKESKTLDSSVHSTPKKIKMNDENDVLNINTSHQKTSKIVKQFLKNDSKTGNQNKRNNLKRSLSFVATNENKIKEGLRKTKSFNDLSCNIKVDISILTGLNDISAKIDSLHNCINDTSKISCSLTSPIKVSNESDYRDELLSLLCSKSSENVLESSDAVTRKQGVNDKIKVKKRKRAMRIESSDDEAPEEKRTTLKSTEQPNKNDTKIKHNEKTKENHTQQIKKDEKSIKQTAVTQKETLTSIESEQHPTKYLTKAEYVKVFSKNKSPVPDISLSISAVSKIQNIKKRRSTFTCETDNETILKKINSKIHYKQKFLHLFGSVSEDEEDIVPLPAGTAKTSFRLSKTPKEGNIEKLNENNGNNNKEKEGLSESSESNRPLESSRKHKRSSNGSTSDCKRKKLDIEQARSSKERSSIKNQETPEHKYENSSLLSLDTKNMISNHRRESTSSTASTDSKSRDINTKKVIKKIKLLEDVKRDARSQSKESDTSMSSDTGKQENKHKKKLEKKCIADRRDSSSSNASCKSENDQHNKQKGTKHLTKKVEKCKKSPTKLKESNQASNQGKTIVKSKKEHKQSPKNQTKSSSEESSKHNKKSMEKELSNKTQQKTCSKAVSSETVQSNENVTKKDIFIPTVDSSCSMKTDKASTKSVKHILSLQYDEKVKPKPLKHLKEYHRRYSAPDTLNSFLGQSLETKSNKKSPPVYRSSENEVIVTVENCRPFVPDIPKFKRITKITRVENECTDMAYINEKPDINSKIETVMQSVSKEDDDVIEIRPTIPMIDLTEDRRTSRENSPEKIPTDIKLKTENITDEDEYRTNTITVYRSEEDNSIQDKEVQPVSVTLSPAAAEKIISLKKNHNVEKNSSSKEYRSVPSSNTVVKDKTNAEVNNTQNTHIILENSNETASAAASQSFSSLVQDLDINSEIRDETNSGIREEVSSDAADKNTNLSNSHVGPGSAGVNVTCPQPQEKLMSLEDENQRAITSILAVINTSQISLRNENTQEKFTGPGKQTEQTILNSQADKTTKNSSNQSTSTNQILLGNKNTQENFTESGKQIEQTILNFSADKTTNCLNQSTDTLFSKPSNIFKRPKIIVKPTRAEIHADSSITQRYRSTVPEAIANQNAAENQSFGQHRGLPQTLDEHRPVQRPKVVNISTPPVLLNMNLPQTSSPKSNRTGSQIQLAGTSQVLNTQNVSYNTDSIINESNRSETVQNRKKNSDADSGQRTGEKEDPVIDLTEEGGELSLIDRRLIIDVFTRHLYFLAHLCKAQNGYIEYLRSQPHCQNYFKAEIALFEQQKQARLISQSLRLVTELHYLNIRASRNLSTTASEIVDQVTRNLSAKNMPKQTTLSMTYLLIGQLIRPQSENFAKIPLFKALYRLCNVVVSKIYSKYPCQLTEEQRNILIQQIHDYNKMIVGSSVSSVDQPRSQSNAQTLHTALNNPSTSRSISTNANNTPALSSSIENNQIGSRQIPNSGQTLSVAGPTQKRPRFLLPQPPQTQQSLSSFNNSSQSNVPLSINNNVPPTNVFRGPNSVCPRSRGPPNVMVRRVDNFSTWSRPPNMANISGPTNNIGQTSVHSNLMNPPAVNRSMSGQLRSVRIRQPSAIVVPNNSHQTVRSTQDLPGGANTNTLGCTPRYVANYDIPQQGHLYTGFARPGQQPNNSNATIFISNNNLTNTNSSTGPQARNNNLQKQNTQVGNNMLETPATILMASTPQRNILVQSPRNDIFQSPFTTPIYNAPMAPPPSYEETVANSSRQSPSTSLSLLPPTAEVKKRSENLLRELLSTTADESLFAQPPSPVNDSFRVKLPFSTPAVISTTTTISNSASGSLTSNPVIFPAPPSQVLNTVNANSVVQSTVPLKSNIQTSLESLDSGVSQTPIVLVNNTAASTSFVVGQSKSPVVLNQGLAALSSIGQASAMLSSSHQTKFGQCTTTSQNENESCVNSTKKTDSFYASSIAKKAKSTKNSDNKPKSHTNYKFTVVTPSSTKETKGKVVKKKIPKAKPKSKGRGRPAKQKKDKYSKSIEIVNLLSSSDEEAPFDNQTNKKNTSNDQIIGEPDNGSITSSEPVISEIVNGTITSSDHVISNIVNDVANKQTEIGISQVKQTTENATHDENVVREDVSEEQAEIYSSQAKQIAIQNAKNVENVVQEDVAAEQAEIGSSQVKQLVTQTAKNVVREDEADTIDLTWIDDMDNDELQREMDFVFVKKEESPEEEQNLNNSSNDDDTIYTTVVQKLCMCTGPADYNCVCGEAWYCGQECQVKDWDSHQKVCQIAHEARETEEEPINEEVELIDET